MRTLSAIMSRGAIAVVTVSSVLTGAWVVMAAAIVLTVLTGIDYVVSAIRDSRSRPAAQ